MLQVARLAPKILGDSAALVVEFLLRQQNPDGGFKDREGRAISIIPSLLWMG